MDLSVEVGWISNQTLPHRGVHLLPITQSLHQRINDERCRRSCSVIPRSGLVQLELTLTLHAFGDTRRGRPPVLTRKLARVTCTQNQYPHEAFRLPFPPCAVFSTSGPDGRSGAPVAARRAHKLNGGTGSPLDTIKCLRSIDRAAQERQGRGTFSRCRLSPASSADPSMITEQLNSVRPDERRGFLVRFGNCFPMQS
jgi:hypothetical protein